MRRALIALTALFIPLLGVALTSPVATGAPARPTVVHLLGNSHVTGGQGGNDVDAVINHTSRQITIVHRDIPRGHSQLTVGWINTNTGRSGITALKGWAERTITTPPYCAVHTNGHKYCFPGSSYRVTDATAVLPTGAGRIAVGITGLLPRLPSCLVPVLPECYGLFFPGGWVLTV